jgi:hypothetical protein
VVLVSPGVNAWARENCSIVFSLIEAHIQKPATSTNARLQLNTEPNRTNQETILLETILPREERRSKKNLIAGRTSDIGDRNMSTNHPFFGSPIPAY